MITRLELYGMTLILLAHVLSNVPSHGAAVEQQQDHDRVLHGRPLSDKEHKEGDYDDHEYDHEAFLGDMADEYDELAPDESKRRLGMIVDRIDADSDGKVSVEELQMWIKTTHQKYIGNDVERQWSQHKADEKNTIGWTEYRNNIYSFLDDGEFQPEEEGGFSYKEMEDRDFRRWSLADTDQDGELTKEEFQSFLHPENAEHMRDIVVTETIEDIDKDKDGQISIDEYIGDMFKASGENPDEEPEWVKVERDNFARFRDSNGDGFLDKEEVKAWIIPPDFDHSEAEAKHLVFEADSDQDNALTKEEILDNYDLFVGSQATDFGEALNRHDEF